MSFYDTEYSLTILLPSFELLNCTLWRLPQDSRIFSEDQIFSKRHTYHNVSQWTSGHFLDQIFNSCQNSEMIQICKTVCRVWFDHQN